MIIIKIKQVEQIVIEPVIKFRCNWEPKKSQRAVKTFVEAVENNVDKILHEKRKLPKNIILGSDKVA